MNESPVPTSPLDLQVRTARLVLFGFEPTAARVEIQPRDVAWRAMMAGVFMGGGVLASPIAALVPPHAPWAIGALGVGAILARRKWREHATLMSLEGTCPRCEASIRSKRSQRMREPHTVSCEGCHYEMTVQLSD